MPLKELYQDHHHWASLVAQWLRIRLPMQGTRVQSLIREDPTCRRATKPQPVLRNKRSHRNEKPVHHNEEEPPLTATRESPRDFPGGVVVKNPPANAGDRGSIPGPGRSHVPRSNKARVPQLLSLHSRAREPQLLSPHAATTEARVPRDRARQQEKPLQ
ncbi:hypothetical protein J1605_004753 [Eschrichtius robustus]|uniref:Uncharacterized protein n=1 Tax=Eschrichtius robustus TaxID=9764 RepID=A0AB34HB20_ESCRO|nr:hypothetical protein J1605_004753 [Eschrichtius robustus]